MILRFFSFVMPPVYTSRASKTKRDKRCSKRRYRSGCRCFNINMGSVCLKSVLAAFSSPISHSSMTTCYLWLIVLALSVCSRCLSSSLLVHRDPSVFEEQCWAPLCFSAPLPIDLEQCRQWMLRGYRRCLTERRSRLAESRTSLGTRFP